MILKVNIIYEIYLFSTDIIIVYIRINIELYSISNSLLRIYDALLRRVNFTSNEPTALLSYADCRALSICVFSRNKVEFIVMYISDNLKII